MPRYPSKTILIQDVLGEARELVAVEEARLQLKSVGRMFYNFAIAELHNVIGYIDEESLLTDTAVDIPAIATKYYSKDLAASAYFDNYDKIKAIYATNGLDMVQGFPVTVTEFLSHRANGSAKYPYGDGLVYTEIGTSVHAVFGTDVILNTPTLRIVYKRQPQFVTNAQYLTGYVDIPDKYYPLLVSRIASLAEMRNGVTEKALVLVKQSYEQLLAAADPVIKAKLMDSLTYRPTTLGSNIDVK